MSIFFVQHGIALDKSVDAERPLSIQGEEYVKKIAYHLAKQDLRIKQIFHSGKTRAEQTAVLFASILNVAETHQHDLLNPNDDVNQLIPQLQDDCMYVGHLPHLGQMVSRLLCGDENTEVVQYENAAVVCIKRNGKDYYLDWMLKPSIL